MSLPTNITNALPLPPELIPPTPVGPVTPGTGADDLGKAEGQAFQPGDVGVEALAVVDDGTVPVPAVGDYTPPRIDPSTRGVIVGPQLGALIQGVEFTIIVVGQETEGPFAGLWRSFQFINGALRVALPDGVEVHNNSGEPLRTTVTGWLQESLLNFANNETKFSTQAGQPQRSLGVTLNADGTVTAATMTIQVADGSGYESGTIIVLHETDLSILKFATVGGPFGQVKATLTGLTLGTATRIDLAIYSSAFA